MKRYIFLLIVFLTTQGVIYAEEVYVAPIKGTIERGIAAFITRVMTDAENNGADAVIFEIDTPGGALDAALTIRDAILYSEVKTIAFIHPRAISAGALISLATDHIVMLEGGTIGAATAVDQQGNKASEKIISYFRNEMKATAEKTGRPSKLAEGMVDEDVDIEDLAPKGKLLTLTTEEALEQGIAEHIITESNRSEQLVSVLKHYNLENANILRQTTNWTEVIVRWLTYPTLASLLMSLGFLGLIFEIQSPGWGIGGTLGLICLGLFFGSHLLVHLADWGEIMLFFLGLILVFVDLFFVAGFGVMAIPGVGLMIIGLFLSLMGRTELWTLGSISDALTPLLAAMIITTILAIVMIRMLPKSSFWERVVLTTEEKASDGYRVSPYEDFRGATGIARTDLRPSGTGEFDGRRVSVATEGNFLEKDSPITVVNIEGSYIIVRKSDEVES
ncbi:MAG: nodulation protein NfeD [Candidatus Latescibacteria bacterium]|nr:nodulation protein NfeD [Candidatus Latescibacterota bacterium]MBT4138787.1 nodulation protein NfeD [Candidatus Latescibacterota bacterium]